MTDSTPATAAPCRCHTSWAYVVPLHQGHCCFFPEGKTCHQDAVAEWERQRDLRRGVTANA